MAKNVFRPTEVVNLSKKVFIEAPLILKTEEPVKPEKAEEEYLGPSLDDLKSDREEFLSTWEGEKARMIEEAKAEAEKIVAEAQQVAFEEVKKKTNQAQKIRQDAEQDVRKIMEDAQAKATEIESGVNQKVDQLEHEAFDKGYREGHEQGYKNGKEEAERLVERLHLVLTKAIDKRNDIINESETQLVNLVLLISKKVIKVISENQKNVVINNVIQALRKLKSRGDVVIRVNLSDLELATEHTKDFLKMVENVKSVTILEDTSVDKGGCIIETDFGQIDARISSQLHEIEEKIIELMPIKTRGEG